METELDQASTDTDSQKNDFDKSVTNTRDNITIISSHDYNNMQLSDQNMQDLSFDYANADNSKCINQDLTMCSESESQISSNPGNFTLLKNTSNMGASGSPKDIASVLSHRVEQLPSREFLHPDKASAINLKDKVEKTDSNLSGTPEMHEENPKNSEESEGADDKSILSEVDHIQNSDNPGISGMDSVRTVEYTETSIEKMEVHSESFLKPETKEILSRTTTEKMDLDPALDQQSDILIPTGTPLESDLKTTASKDFKDINKSSLVNNTRQGTNTEEPAEPEFMWEDYLEKTGSVAAPPTAFKHVEYSLESGFIKGMKLEVPNKCFSDTYWVASVIMTCSQLLRLRYDGYEADKSADFWCDLMTAEIHPIGWCAQNNQVLQPPEDIKDKFDDWREFLVRSLTGARTAPSYLLDKVTGTMPVDQLKPGMRLEIQHPVNSMDVWLVKIIENVGGRLYLRFEGTESSGHDFWLFYLNHRLHPIGWATSHGLQYNPPPEICLGGETQHWKEVLQSALEEAENMTFPLAVFRNQEEIEPHSFEVGWKLEALSPLTKSHIYPATVTRVLNNFYFIIEIDSVKHNDIPLQFSCNSHSMIFPCNWCQCNGVNLTPPIGWNKTDFHWSRYLQECDATAAPESCFNLQVPAHEFQNGMKVEAVNPENPNQICAATIVKVIEPLLWIHLDNSARIVGSHIEHMKSHNLFPVGWCESNEYQLKPPRIFPTAKKVAVVQPETRIKNSDAYSQMRYGKSAGEWCPKIYYNHRCFSGPYLSKSRIASLPKCVGPGPITLVMKEVLSNLINVAYKSCRVLRELQMEGKPNPSMHQQTIKAKYKGKSYRAIVEVCQSMSQLEEFCRQICIKLECCPNLISTINVKDSCPENCSQLTKTQYTYYYGKTKVKKPIGRPPGSHTNSENVPKKRGRKKKFKMLNNTANEEGEAEENNSEEESVKSDGICEQEQEKGPTSKYKRKYTHHVPPPSEIKTRGANLPKYSYDRKTHKKILLSHRHYHEDRSHKVKAVKSETNKKGDKSSCPGDMELVLTSNPLMWSVSEVTKYIKSTECSPLARVLKEQEIDGQALLLLSLPVLQEYLDLKLGPAIKLCHHIEKIKLAFYRQYAYGS